MPSETRLDDRLSRPRDEDVAVMASLEDDLVLLGAAGKMGPTLARLARRAGDAAGWAGRVIGIARFRDDAVRRALEHAGIETVQCDLLDRDAVLDLPDAGCVLYLAGRKFGTGDDPAATWAGNTIAPMHAAERYRRARIVAFSTGNIYPLVPVDAPPPAETHAPAPVGEYAQSALARERILTWMAGRHGTPLALLRLNYAVEPRYGVLRDLADRIMAGRPINLRMGHVNVIWQRDACSVALRALTRCAIPPAVLNVAGPDVLEVRAVATALGERLGRVPVFEGTEAPTALLSDASRMVGIFGPPATPLDVMLDEVAEWVRAGGRSLGLETHYDVRDGAF